MSKTVTKLRRDTAALSITVEKEGVERTYAVVYFKRDNKSILAEHLTDSIRQFEAAGYNITVNYEAIPTSVSISNSKTTRTFEVVQRTNNLKSTQVLVRDLEDFIKTYEHKGFTARVEYKEI